MVVGGIVTVRVRGGGGILLRSFALKIQEHTTKTEMLLHLALDEGGWGGPHVTCRL